jgi:hypothetical protein
MSCDDLEPVVWWHGEGCHQRIVDGVGDGPARVGRDGVVQVDAYERHVG